jgi:hypothetical protein
MTTPNSTNPYADFLATWGGLAGVVSLLVSVFILLRGWYRDRSHLWFIQNEDISEQSFCRTLNVRSPGETHHVIGSATLTVSNNSSRPNAILRWTGTVRDVDGRVRNVDMSGPQHLTGFPPFNTMVSLPAFTSAEAHLLFYVDVRTLPNPVVFRVTATDRTKKMYRLSVSIPNAVRNTLSGQ